MTAKGYYKFEILSNNIKERNKIKTGASVPRYDCTKYFGEYEGLQTFKNSKGMFFLYLHESENLIKANQKRLSEFVLKGTKSLNFTSLYFEDISNPNLCFGYPNGKPQLGNGQPNPLLQYRQDLYLFIIKDDFSDFELIIYENGKSFASDYLQCLASGDFDDAIEEMRNKAIDFFKY